VHRAGSQLAAAEAGRAGGFMARLEAARPVMPPAVAPEQVYFQVPGGAAGELETGDERALRQLCESFAERHQQQQQKIQGQQSQQSQQSSASAASSSALSASSHDTSGGGGFGGFGGGGPTAADRRLLDAVREIGLSPARFVDAMVTLTARATAQVREEARRVDPARDAELLGYRLDPDTGDWVDDAASAGDTGDTGGGDGATGIVPTTLQQIRALRDEHSAAFVRAASLDAERADLEHRLAMATDRLDARDVAATRLSALGGEAMSGSSHADPDILEHVRVLQRLQVDVAGETAAIAEAERLAAELAALHDLRRGEREAVAQARRQLDRERSAARADQATVQGLIGANLEARRSLVQRCDAFSHWVDARIGPLAGRISAVAARAGTARRAECRAVGTAPYAAFDHLALARHAHRHDHHRQHHHKRQGEGPSAPASSSALSASSASSASSSASSAPASSSSSALPALSPSSAAGARVAPSREAPSHVPLCHTHVPLCHTHELRSHTHVLRCRTHRERAAHPDAALGGIRRALGLPAAGGHLRLLGRAAQVAGGAAAAEVAAEWAAGTWENEG
jgi:hypothetical protein